MKDLETLLAMSPAQLREVLAKGHPIEAGALDDTEYKGISLGLPRWVESLAWKTFKKVFHRDRSDGELRGWNVRIAQDGVEGRYEPLRDGDEPRTFGHYRVVPAQGRKVPRGCDRGLLIDYGLGGNGTLDPMGLVRDPLVALEPGSTERLLGYSYVDLWGLQLGTPTYFLLLRDGPLTHIHQPR